MIEVPEAGDEGDDRRDSGGDPAAPPDPHGQFDALGQQPESSAQGLLVDVGLRLGQLEGRSVLPPPGA